MLARALLLLFLSQRGVDLPRVLLKQATGLELLERGRAKMLGELPSSVWKLRCSFSSGGTVHVRGTCR